MKIRARAPHRRHARYVVLIACLFGSYGVGPCLPAQEIACADPEDCRLWEAAALSGVRFGFHDQNGAGGPDGELAALEGNAYTNHGVSWRSFQPTPDGVTASMDANCDFAAANGLFQVGFHFAWDQQLLDDLAGWVLDIHDPDTLRDVLRERARRIFARCPSLDRISVVNEPLRVLTGNTLFENHFFQVLGPDYIAELFRIVRDEAPDHVGLFINDYAIEYYPDRAAAYVDLIRSLVESGAPIDAVGLQTHLFLVNPPFTAEPDFALYRKTMEEIAALGLKILVSELDVPIPPELPNRVQIQSDRYREVVESCLAVPACDTIIVWGIDDANTWLDDFLLTGPDHDPLLFDAALERKPAYFAVRDALLRGRGGDHPIAADTLRITRPDDRGFLALHSTDRAVVSPTPGSHNDPRDTDGNGGTIELFGSQGLITTVTLPPGNAWRVRPGESKFLGRLLNGPVVRLRLREGKRLDLVLRDPLLAPGDATEGIGIRITLGSLRVCTVFGPESIASGSTPHHLVATQATRLPGYDCSLSAPLR